MNYSFVTIWIFARIRLEYNKDTQVACFVTIWIFARIRHGEGNLSATGRFVTI